MQVVNSASSKMNAVLEDYQSRKLRIAKKAAVSVRKIFREFTFVNYAIYFGAEVKFYSRADLK